MLDKNGDPINVNQCMTSDPLQRLRALFAVLPPAPRSLSPLLALAPAAEPALRALLLQFASRFACSSARSLLLFRPALRLRHSSMSAF